MKTSAKIDRDGRILIPNAIRKAVGIAPGNELTLTAEGNKLIVENKAEKCIICGTEEGLEKIDILSFCKEHKQKLIKILGGTKDGK